MKNKFCLFIVFCITYQSIIGMFLFQIRTVVHHFDIEKKIASPCYLQTLSFELQYFKEHKVNGTELLIDGEYFDIKSVRLYGNKVIVTGLWDKNEKVLIASFSEAFNQETGNILLTLFPSILTPAMLNKTEFWSLIMTVIQMQTNFILRFCTSYEYTNSLTKPPKA